jgi:hypothetical protein
LLVREVTAMSRSSESHSIRMTYVPIGLLTFSSRNGVNQDQSRRMPAEWRCAPAHDSART